MTEHEIQCAFVRRFEALALPDWDLAHANPNGGQRHILVAAKLKAEGVRPGVPDWQWPVQRGGFAGLAIEFKAGDGNPSKAQRDRIDALQRAGWCVVLCWSADAAIAVVRGYAGMTRVIFEGANDER